MSDLIVAPTTISEIKPHPNKVGRVILKRINDDYLIRKGGSENH